MIHVPKYDKEDRSPTWWEGYQARAAGWRLHADASDAYRDGWLYRNALEEE
jgi:hypothetical protein